VHLALYFNFGVRRFLPSPKLQKLAGSAAAAAAAAAAVAQSSSSKKRFFVSIPSALPCTSCANKHVAGGNDGEKKKKRRKKTPGSKDARAGGGGGGLRIIDDEADLTTLDAKKVNKAWEEEETEGGERRGVWRGLLPLFAR